MLFFLRIHSSYVLKERRRSLGEREWSMNFLFDRNTNSNITVIQTILVITVHSSHVRFMHSYHSYFFYILSCMVSISIDLFFGRNYYYKSCPKLAESEVGFSTFVLSRHHSPFIRFINIRPLIEPFKPLHYSPFGVSTWFAITDFQRVSRPRMTSC